ncbi:hypothetical protein VP01_6153g2 [Puccinia sorghi]|uniref:Uncharacterized protein n=1 Tax=Puccinia sorghi TaxID=27349 RepID=A0A0L6UGT8_9BASI|nr:hypothetical protein VP01_6153g2 [Puccinia sorghi]
MQGYAKANYNILLNGMVISLPKIELPLGTRQPSLKLPRFDSRLSFLLSSQTSSTLNHHFFKFSKFFEQSFKPPPIRIIKSFLIIPLFKKKEKKKEKKKKKKRKKKKKKEKKNTIYKEKKNLNKTLFLYFSFFNLFLYFFPTFLQSYYNIGLRCMLPIHLNFFIDLLLLHLLLFLLPFLSFVFLLLPSNFLLLNPQSSKFTFHLFFAIFSNFLAFDLHPSKKLVFNTNPICQSMFNLNQQQSLIIFESNPRIFEWINQLLSWPASKYTPSLPLLSSIIPPLVPSFCIYKLLCFPHYFLFSSGSTRAYIYRKECTSSKMRLRLGRGSKHRRNDR